MRQSAKVEGTKIAQAAKDLNVTSVTIRRYLQEFNIETTSDENGIKVLPEQAMEELRQIRKLKEEGLTNPKVLEILEEQRTKIVSSKPAKSKEERSKSSDKTSLDAQSSDAEESPTPKFVDKKKAPQKRGVKPQLDINTETEPGTPAIQEPEAEAPTEGEPRSKHSLTCQTCGKVFEHMNPRLRDCLDCYRTKRKERRRGGSEKHKNVIQHPLAQQAMSKAAPTQQASAASNRPPKNTSEPQMPASQPAPLAVPQAFLSVPSLQRGPVRNYRKAIEETRQITGSLKRRLERPDLPEGERRWLEQIYAYQLILHQGWRHLSEYKTAGQQQSKQDD